MSRKKNEEDSNRCVLTLPLLTEPWQEQIIEKRFRIMEHLINSLIAFELRKLRNLERRKHYRQLKEEIANTAKDKRKSLYAKRNKLIKESGFTEFEFKNDMTTMQKHFAKHIAAQVSHKAASDVWRAFDRYFYGDGRRIHFKRKGTLSSISHQSMNNGMNYRDGYFIWGLRNPSKKRKREGKVSRNDRAFKIAVASPRTEYEQMMMDKKMRNLRIIRKWMKTRYKYYLQFNLEGSAAKKERKVTNGRVGIDMGTQSIAIVSENGVHLWELADHVNDNHNKILILQRKMDNSRRAMNPENYNQDGTICRGKKLYWRQSKHYRRLAGKVRELQRKNADIRKYQHTCLANYILSLGNEIIIEPMQYRGLQRRAKETKKDATGRYLRKKRFGKSLANKAPAMFITILEWKLKQYGGNLERVDIYSFKASQYDHLSKQYEKKKLSQRRHVLANGDVLQRDLYSAFLLMNADSTLEKPDEALCDLNYVVFKNLHDKEISRLQESGDRKLSSFGVA